MSVHSLSHPGRRHVARLLSGAACSWLGIVAVVFLFEVVWRGLRASEEGVPAAEWADGIIAGGIVLLSAWFYVYEQAGDAGPRQLAVVGAVWVSLSITLEYVYRLYAVHHYVMRFLMSMFMGDYRGSNGWLWDLFLAVQLVGPVSMGVLSEVLSDRKKALGRVRGDRKLPGRGRNL